VIVLLLLLLIVGIEAIRIGGSFFLIIFKSFLSGFFEEFTLFAEVATYGYLIIV